MIFSVNLEVNDLERSARFYDAFLGELNAKRILEIDKLLIGWGSSIQDTYLCIAPKAASDKVDSACIVTFGLESIAEVDRVFAKALEFGAQLGTSLSRNEHDYYAGTLLDPDGHKLRLFSISA